MKKMLALALALMMALSLAACGNPGGGGGSAPGNGSDPAEGYDAEYTIYVNGSDEWTPFAGKSGVSFSVSDDTVISASDNGTKSEFTGKQVGESVITAALDGAESKALVRVRAMEQGENEDGAVPLIRELPDSYYIAYETPDTLKYTGTSYEVFTGDSYSYFCNQKDGDGYMPGTEHYTPFGYYQSGYGEWSDCTDASTYGIDSAKKFERWRTEEDGMIWGTLCAFRTAVINNQISGTTKPWDISGLRKGTETEVIAGIECEIYEVEDKTWNEDVICTYWVEPTYHFCLKCVNPVTDWETFTVTEYIVPYDGENPFVPSSYDGLPGG